MNKRMMFGLCILFLLVGCSSPSIQFNTNFDDLEGIKAEAEARLVDIAKIYLTQSEDAYTDSGAEEYYSKAINALNGIESEEANKIKADIKQRREKNDKFTEAFSSNWKTWSFIGIILAVGLFLGVKKRLGETLASFGTGAFLLTCTAIITWWFLLLAIIMGIIIWIRNKPGAT